MRGLSHAPVSTLLNDVDVEREAYSCYSKLTIRKIQKFVLNMNNIYRALEILIFALNSSDFRIDSAWILIGPSVTQPKEAHMLCCPEGIIVNEEEFTDEKLNQDITSLKRHLILKLLQLWNVPDKPIHLTNIFLAVKIANYSHRGLESFTAKLTQITDLLNFFHLKENFNIKQKKNVVHSLNVRVESKNINDITASDDHTTQCQDYNLKRNDVRVSQGNDESTANEYRESIWLVQKKGIQGIKP
jgi:hypothetical protein